MATNLSKAGAKSATKIGNGSKDAPAPKPARKTTAAKTTATDKPEPKYIAQQANRKRFAFGPVWNANVLAGKVKDKIKLVAQAQAMGLGTAKELANKSLDEMIEIVADGLRAAEKETTSNKHH